MKIPAAARFVDIRNLDVPTVVVCPRCFGRGKTKPAGAFTTDGSLVMPDVCFLCEGHRIVYKVVSYEAISDEHLTRSTNVKE